MTPELWAEVDPVLTAVLALDPEQRTTYLTSVCGDRPNVRAEVESLLASHARAADFLEAGNRTTAGDRSGLPSPPPIGSRVGPYRLVQEIGRGGMGTVYLGQRDDGQFDQRVAIKLMTGTMPAAEMLSRFQSERQILARLEHPNIARLLDGGVNSDGSPYIAMEFVGGVPIWEYANSRNLSVDERLALFRTVCSAVHFAHQNLVVHRDLKPANILITAEGVPKLLDFGIAKILSGQAAESTEPATLPLMKAMTPDYASPEQVRGLTITTASDIYSLGVLLYELLAGNKPYQLAGCSLDKIVHTVCVEEPPKPSSINPKVPADLDAITLKALRKEPEERYSSAKEFSEDLGRFLDGVPVLARRGSFRYIAWKYIQRHRQRATALLTALVLLVAGLGGVAWEARVADRERAKAQRRFNEVRKLANSIVFDVNDSLSGLPGSAEARRLLVAKGLEYLNALQGETEADPGLQQEIGVAYLRMGDVQGNVAVANLGDSHAAIGSYQKAAQLLGAVLVKKPADGEASFSLVEAYRNLSSLESVVGDSKESLKVARQAVAIAEPVASRDPSGERARRSLASAYFSLAMALKYDDAAVKTWHKCLDIFEALLRANPEGDREQRNVALVYKYLSEILRRKSQLDLSLEYAKRAEDLDSRRLSAKPSDRTTQLDLALDFGSTADCYERQGDLGHALDRYERSLELRRRLALADPKDARIRGRLLYAELVVGNILLKTGKFSDAIQHYTPAAAIGEDLIAKDPAVIDVRRNLSYALAGMGDAWGRLGQESKSCPLFKKALLIHADVDRLGASLEGERHDADLWRERVTHCK